MCVFQARILAIILFFVCILPMALSAEDDAGYNDEVEEIVVVGVQQSFRRALSQRRGGIVNRVNPKDKRASSDAADALNSISGVSVDSDIEDGTAISIRGQENTRVEIDGRSPLGEGEDGSIDLSTIPSELLSRIEIIKTPRADLVEGSLGGTVRLHLQKPLDIRDPVTTLTLRGGYGEMGGAFSPRLTANIARRQSSKWGPIGWTVRLALDHYEREEQRAYIGRWYASCAYDFDGDGTLNTTPPKGEGGTVIPTVEDCVDAGDFHFRPNELTVSQTVSEGDNNSLSVSAQWEPVKKLRFSLEAGLRESIRHIHRSSLGLGRSISAENSSNIESLVLNDNHSAVYALYTDRNFSSQSFSLERKGEYKNLALTAQWRDEDWEIDGELSTSLADTQYPNQRLEFRSAKADHEQEISTTKEGISGKFLPSGSVSEASAWKFHNYDSSRGGYVSDRISAKFDAKKYVGQGQGFTSWKMGGRIDRKKVKRNSERWRFSDGGNLSFRNASLAQTIVQHPELANGFLRLSEGSFSDSFPSIEMPASWLAPNRHSFTAWENALNIGEFIPNPSQEYEQKETVSALYFLGEFAKNRMRGNMGLRYVDTAQEFYWNQTVRNSAGEGTNTTIPLHTDNHSQNWLPSLYMSFGMGRGKFFRFGLARAISRPSTGQLRPAYRINYYNKTGRRGNPNLTPARAVQYDFGYEYQYGRRAGQLSFGVFYHDIRNFIYYTRAVESLVLDLGGAAEEVEISKPEKGVGGWTRGLEAGWRQSFRTLPAPWKYISMKMDVSVSKHFRPLYNAELLRTDLSHISLRRKQSLTLYYDQAPFSARLSYVRNARRFRNATSQSGRPEYDAPRNSLDFFIQYRVNEDSRISFTAKNLTDEKYIRYNGEPAAILRESHNGRSFEISWQTSF